jgi:hypothetical protein
MVDALVWTVGGVVFIYAVYMLRRLHKAVARADRVLRLLEQDIEEDCVHEWKYSRLRTARACAKCGIHEVGKSGAWE